LTALWLQADRIQAHAVRRCGKLLKQFDGRGGGKSKRTIPSILLRRESKLHKVPA